MTDSQFFLWLATFVTLVGSFVFLSFRASPQLAIGIVTSLTMVVPAWLVIPLFDTPNGTLYGSGLDLKLAVMASCLLLYCFMPGRAFPIRMVPSDFAMIALVVVHLASDVSNSGFTGMIFARIYAEWFAPYVAGRLALEKYSFTDSLWKTLALTSAVIGFFSVIESITRFNVFEFIAGERPIEGFSRDVSRWGLRRAYGPAMHPIYFGGLQLLLLAWPAYGVVQALRGRAFFGWIFLPVVSVLGIFATGSRAPILCVPVFLLFVAFVLFRRSRLPLFITFAVLSLLATVNGSWIIEKLEDWSGESRDAQYSRVKIDGKKVVVSGTRSRLLLLDVYRIAITRSGFLGYGTVATTGFPIDVPVNGQDPDTLKKVKYIDNAYLLVLFRFGYAGVTCFVLACFACVLQFFSIGRISPKRSIHYLCAMLGASLLACCCLISTVWLPSDISYPMLWTMGISSGVFHALLRDRFLQKRHSNAFP